MSSKEFIIDPEQIKELIKPMGYSIVSNMISQEGMPVGFMYREEPFDEEDSGWRFLSGTETEEYLDEDTNSKAISVNAVANHDPAIIPYLRKPEDTAWERKADSEEFIQSED
mgnify:CR=1 FL=1